MYMNVWVWYWDKMYFVCLEEGHRALCFPAGHTSINAVYMQFYPFSGDFVCIYLDPFVTIVHLCNVFTLHCFKLLMLIIIIQDWYNVIICEETSFQALDKLFNDYICLLTFDVFYILLMRSIFKYFFWLWK